MSILKNNLIILLVAFLEGCIFLTLETLAPVLLIPHVGYSSYLWAAIISSTLFGLAIGYKIGGKISDKSKALLYSSIGLSGSLISISLLYSSGFSLLNLESYKTEVLLLSMMLCFIPSLILGIFSPILVYKLEIKNSAGVIFAVSTLGGLLSTILSTWYITPNLGAHYTMWYLIAISISIIALLSLKKD